MNAVTAAEALSPPRSRSCPDTVDTATEDARSGQCARHRERIPLAVTPSEWMFDTCGRKKARKRKVTPSGGVSSREVTARVEVWSRSLKCGLRSISSVAMLLFFSITTTPGPGQA